MSEPPEVAAEAWSYTGTSADGSRALYRRTLLECPHGEPVHLADVAREVASECDRVDPRSAYIELYHVHAPMLADAGLLSFDADEKTVVRDS